jgi:hypothetical protein
MDLEGSGRGPVEVTYRHLCRGTDGSFPGVKQSGREDDHSPPSTLGGTMLPVPTRIHGVVLN